MKRLKDRLWTNSLMPIPRSAIPAILMIIGMAVLFLRLLVDSPLTTTIGMLAIGLGGGMVISTPDRAVVRTARNIIAEKSGRVSGEPSHCTDCGQPNVLWREQSGFLTNGEPFYHQRLACPDFDPQAMANSMSSRTGMPSAYAATTHENGICGKRVTTPLTKVLPDHDHPPTRPTVTCERCVYDMHDQGVISRDEMNSMLKKLK